MNEQFVTDELNIRLLTPDDADEWWRLRREALQNDPEAFSSSAEDRQSLTAEDVRSHLSSNPAEFFIVGAFDIHRFDGHAFDGHAFDNDRRKNHRLGGMAGFYREQGRKSCHKGSVWGVYVTPQYRGRGVGRRLMQALLERAAGIHGIEQILISVTATQTAASSLYRSLGFQPFGREPRALKIGNRYIDEEHMMLTLERSNPLD